MGITGGCACGAIRYDAAAEPTFMFKCHCRDCQRASGTGHAAIMVVPKAAVSISGTPRYHVVTGSSGHKVSRGFCPDCGSPLCITLESLPAVFGIQAASLDEPGRFKPGMDVYIDSARSWDHMDPSLPKKPRGPRE